MLKIFRVLFRLSLLSAYLTTGVLLALIFLTKPLKSLSLYNSKTLIRQWISGLRYFTGCRIANVPTALNKPTLVISNHISWLDILVLGGCYEVHFLSKEEVKKWPVIGFLAVMTGTLLIKRGSGSNGAIEEIRSTLQNGHNVCFFPEGTTSSGEKTKIFHSRLLKSAYLCQTTISVVSLSYSSNGISRDLKMGWQKQSFFQHLLYVLAQKRTEVMVNLVVELSDFKNIERKELAKKSRQLISNDLNNNHYPVPSLK